MTGIGIAIIALIIFQAGVFVGYRKASFAFRFGDNYYRTFGDRGSKPFHIPLKGDFIDAHGTVGKVISVHFPTFVIEGQDAVEKVVRINDETEIRRFRSAATSSDITVDGFVVVIGMPNENAEVEAKLIRILPPPQEQ